MTTYVWIHVVALVAYVLATMAVLLYAIPAARRVSDPQARLARAAAAMKLYDPFSIAVLGVIVMTGAFALTDYKDALRERFFAEMGAYLMWKLSASFALILLGSYLAFGLGNRLVSASERDAPPHGAWVDSMMTRIQVTAVVLLLLCAAIVRIATSH